MSDILTKKTIIISESQFNSLINETHGVSNDYLDALASFILDKIFNSDQRQFSYREIKHCFDLFPENLRKFFRNSKLVINPMVSNTTNGRCEYNVRKKLITVSVRYQNKHDMRTVLYHELTHMIDYAVNKSSKGDEQTKTFAKYNEKIIKNKSKYREFNGIIYAFTNLEMRGRLASFKVKLNDWLADESSKSYGQGGREFLTATKNGYRALFKYFMKELPYTEAYRYAIGFHEDRYKSFIKSVNYGGLGYRGIVELYNNLRSVIDSRDNAQYDEQQISQEDFEKIKGKVVSYFDNIISDYKNKLYKVALDVWYRFIESLKNQYGKHANFRKFMRM